VVESKNKKSKSDFGRFRTVRVRTLRTPPTHRPHDASAHERGMRAAGGRTRRDGIAGVTNVRATVTTHLDVIINDRLVEDVQRRRVVEQHVHDAQRGLSVGRHGEFSTGTDVAGKPKNSTESAAARTEHLA